MLTSTQEILEKAQRYAYAVGAFNLYNLEGAKAVVNAAEADRSPAIIQILPHILKYGGTAVDCPLFRSGRLGQRADVGAS
jgi:tagatose 1,6-diphosphate aldolase GatY/KbaY